MRAGGAADGAENALAEIREQAKLVETAEQSRKQAETARVSAEQGRKTAIDSWTAEEANRVSQEQARVTAEAKRVTDANTAIANLNAETAKANSKVDALVSSTNAKVDAQIALAKEATDKANASASKADTATAKASEATVAATNAATKANEVEAKLTANILKGKVKDTVVHVDDAWLSSLLGIEIEGACKQDGTPSPDNPVPIEVIENPTLKVTGRNLLDTDKGLNNCFTKNADGTYTITKISDNERFSAYIPLRIPSGVNVYLSVTHMSAGVTGSVSIIFDYADGTQYTSMLSSREITAYFAKKDVRFIRFYVEGKVEIGKSFVFLPQIEYGTNATAYVPHVGTSTPFTMPAEHPYLAKLPNGTADTIEVDKEGNVSLVARVGKSIIPETNMNVSDELHNGNDGTSNRAVIFGNLDSMTDGTSLSGSCSMFVNGGNTQNRDTIRIGYGDKHVYLYTVDADIIGDGSADAVNSWLRANQPVITYPLETPVTYPLGKVTVPSLHDSISNVWTEAEVTPKTGIEYTRDVNIAFANIEDAIASITQG